MDNFNALVLTGKLSDRIATAAGAGTSDAAPKPEVGDIALEPGQGAGDAGEPEGESAEAVR